MTAIRLPVRQGTDAWLAARRLGVTSTDIPAILGIDPWGRAEADVALEKATGERAELDPASARRLRLGKKLEEAVRSEDEIEHGIRERRVNQLLRMAEIEWALTSLDFERVGERTIVEAKISASRRRFDGDLPEDIEAQCRWQMGVAGYPRLHVAVLRFGQTLECYDLEHDEETFRGLVRIAGDFWTRYQAGAPLAQSAGSVKRRYPSDNGAEMLADTELADTVHRLLALRAQRRDIEAEEDRAEVALKSRMGEFTTLRGPDFRVVWKRTKDGVATDWKAVADAAIAPLPETERAALVGRFTTVRPGFRPLRVVSDKED